jgi:hypothetical protein
MDSITTDEDTISTDSDDQQLKQLYKKYISISKISDKLSKIRATIMYIILCILILVAISFLILMPIDLAGLIKFSAKGFGIFKDIDLGHAISATIGIVIGGILFISASLYIASEVLDARCGTILNEAKALGKSYDEFLQIAKTDIVSEPVINETIARS